MQKVIVIAHRGWSAKFPENTLLAFREAIALGADAIEFDIRQSMDGELVISHDADISRTTNGKGDISKIMFDKLRTFDAGQGERVPTLREVLELGKGRIAFQCEIKVPNIEDKIVKLIEDVGVMDDTYFSSFGHAIMGKIKALRPAAKVATLETNVDLGSETQQQLMAKKFAERARKVDAMAVHINLNDASPIIFKHLHDSGLRVNVWTVDSEIILEELMNMGVDGIFTNRPDAMLEHLKNRQLK